MGAPFNANGRTGGVASISETLARLGHGKRGAKPVGTRRTGQPVRRSSYFPQDPSALALWRPLGNNRDARRLIAARLQAAEFYDRRHKPTGKKNGPLGHVGLEVLRELYRIVDYGFSLPRCAAAWVKGRLGGAPPPDCEVALRAEREAEVRAMIDALPLAEQPAAIGMMGERQTEQAALFYEFSLERHVPADHLLRSIDRFVDLGGVREHLGPYYSETGRPSIDPELMIRMLIVGYCMGIRSERRLCEEVHLNLAYRWFCRLGLEGDVPDHSTFSKNRHGRFRDSDVLRELFETVVARCMLEGLVGGEGFAVDASLIKADANRQRSVPGSEGLPPDAANHAVREYLAVLDDAAFGAATPVVPKFISPADPASRWTGAHGGLAFFAYSTNYLIDLDHAVIMDVEPSTSVRQAEVTAARRMLERTQDRFGIWPERLAADSAYGSADNLAWLVHERGIEPHIPVFDKSARSDGTFERADFIYDMRRDLYTCPGGEELRRYWHEGRAAKEKPPVDGLYKYRARKAACDACELRRPRCCPNGPHRKILRSIHEGARDLARDIATTDAYVISRRERKKIEMLFAHLKRILKLDRLRLRGPNGARDEFLLAATAHNLRKLAKLIPMPQPAIA